MARCSTHAIPIRTVQIRHLNPPINGTMPEMQFGDHDAENDQSGAAPRNAHRRNVGQQFESVFSGEHVTTRDEAGPVSSARAKTFAVCSPASIIPVPGVQPAGYASFQFPSALLGHERRTELYKRHSVRWKVLRHTCWTVHRCSIWAEIARYSRRGDGKQFLHSVCQDTDHGHDAHPHQLLDHPRFAGFLPACRRNTHAVPIWLTALHATLFVRNGTRATGTGALAISPSNPVGALSASHLQAESRKDFALLEPAPEAPVAPGRVQGAHRHHHRHRSAPHNNGPPAPLPPPIINVSQPGRGQIRRHGIRALIRAA